MQKNDKRTPVHKKVLLTSCLIYISAVLFMIVALSILTFPARAANIHNRQLNVTPINYICSREHKEFYSINPTSCQLDSQKRSLRYEPFTFEDKVDGYVDDICEFYPNIAPEIIKAMIWHESRYNPYVSNGRCVGLMQVSTKWQASRAIELGVTDFYDPYSNILIGVDCLNEIFEDCVSIGLALMIYNGDSRAYSLHNSGRLSSYASGVLSMASDLGLEGVV